MEKDFLNLKTDQKRLYVLILCVGLVLTVLLAVRGFMDTKLTNGYELPKSDAGEGSYEQELFAVIDKERIPVTVEVGERKLSEKEAQDMLSAAAEGLNNILKAENESLLKIRTDVNFVDKIPGTAVDVEWTEKLPDYFYSDGTLKEDLELLEPAQQRVSAILSCQEYTRDYEAVLTILPGTITPERALLEQIEKASENSTENAVVELPKEYLGSRIIWKKPLDLTFLYVGILTGAAVVFLKIGSKRDEDIRKKERLEAMEKDYAQIVSKFTMLLSAGISVRNAWERIVLLSKGKANGAHPVYEEMNWAMRQMQQGASELEVYEKFGIRVGQIHYKKLMALFIMDKKRGSIQLLDAMNQEMLQAFEEQKRKTRQQGEKAGTKLLLPMMGMLAVVFMIILVPAFLSFQL